MHMTKSRGLVEGSALFQNLNVGAIGVKASFEEACSLAQKYGFRGVDIGPGDVERLGVTRVLELLDQHGLKVGGYGFSGKWLGSEEDWKESLQNAPRLLELGRRVGASRVTTYLMAASDERTYLENFAFHVKRLKPVAQVLEDYGFRFGLEFLGPQMFRRGKRYSFLFDVDTCLELCAAINERSCGLLFDVWHWYTSEGTLEQVKKLSDRQVVYVHVNDAPANIPVADQVDSVRCLPGETGVIDIVPVLQTLAENGCQAPVTVEPFNAWLRSLAPDDAVKATAEALNKVWNEAGLGKE